VADKRATDPVAAVRAPAHTLPAQRAAVNGGPRPLRDAAPARPDGLARATVADGAGPAQPAAADAAPDAHAACAEGSCAAPPNRVPGPDRLTRGLWLTVRISAAAILAAGLIHVALTRPEIGIGPPLAMFGLVVLSQVLQVRVRTNGGMLMLGWGEAAAVAASYLLPAGLVPVVFLGGVICAQVFHRWRGRIRRWHRFVNNIATLVIASAAAVAVSRLLGLRPHADFDGRAILALTACAATYCAVTVIVISALIGSESGQSIPALTRVAGRTKVPMAAGNLIIAIATLAGFTANNLWLLALPPALWLLHQTYTHRAHAEDERLSWQTFAAATRKLNHLDEGHAAAAGLDGAVRLFAARTAEIIVDVPPGPPRAYTLDAAGEIVRGTPVEPAEPPVAVRPLLVAGARIGELRLLQVSMLTKRDGLMLNAYGDALAASLHDAATNSELRALTERSTHDATHDALTGLPNRAALLGRGSELLSGVDPAAPVALLLLDINHFKEVNTTLGHAAGDDLLRTTAARLSSADAAGELLVRLGGDEFAVLLTGAGAAQPQALARARHLAAELARPTTVTGVQISVEASIGVVAAPAGEVDVTELLRRADIAMYQAKHDGASVACYEPGRDNASTDRVALLAELREALACQDQIELLFQPAVALATRRPVSVEAFVRWRHPRRGTLKPVDFVRAVEQSELLGQFTRHVLDAALAVAARLREGGADLPVSVNLSPRSLHDRQLPSDVRALLERHGIPPQGLILEITETVVLSEEKVVDEVLADLRALGVQLSVDDFGTGCSALTFLTRVALDEVKVDRTFVTRMADQPEAAAIVRTTVELGRELGRRVVAEGVETAEQCQALIGLGCETAQGFYFYAPMPVPAAVEALRGATSDPAQPVRRLRAAE
jgi:diguanylate cyclase